MNDFRIDVEWFAIHRGLKAARALARLPSLRLQF